MRAGVALLVAVVAQGLAGPVTHGALAGGRVAVGTGTFPRWHAVSVLTDVPLRWITALPPRRVAAVDRDGTFWVFEMTQGRLQVAARYGESASPDGPPAIVRLGREEPGIALIAPDGRLLLWTEGALRAYEVGAPLSRLTVPVPVNLEGKRSHDLLAVAQDGAVLLIGGLAAGAPRVLSRLDVRALPDARITLADLDGDGAPEAVVLSDPTDRYRHGVLGDRLEAAGVSVIGVHAYGLELRGRLSLSGAAVFEDLTPTLAPVGGNGALAVLLARSTPAQGAAPVALGWREGALVPLAEGPALGQGNRWLHLIGAADLSGSGTPAVVAVLTPHIGGVLTAYRRAGGTLVRTARAPGYSSHAIGSRNLDQALIADLDGNGRPEVVVPRQARDVLTGLELQGDRFVERWAIEFKSPVQSNLIAVDLDGDGLLDLAVADRRGLYLFLSVR